VAALQQAYFTQKFRVAPVSPNCIERKRLAVKPRAQELSLGRSSIDRNLLSTLIVVLFSATAFAQASISDGRPVIALGHAPRWQTPDFDVSTLPPGTFEEDADSPNVAQSSEGHGGIVSRSVKRILVDQKNLYLAPFKPSNFKWDAVVLGGTAGLLIADRHIYNALPGGDYTFYQTSSNIAIAGLGAGLAGVWAWGIKGDHPHAREMGNLELETLVNTFLIYVPMQLIAGRQRPGEGNGHGDFLQHHAINTSFPGGHAMFAWAMATVAAREYPKPWVQALVYTAALTVTAGRFLGRDHWSSDMFVGTSLGIAIGTNIFHSRCNPELSESCRRHHGRKLKMPALMLPSPESDAH
jgi:membrane-associated phospholipid phosphatase